MMIRKQLSIAAIFLVIIYSSCGVEDADFNLPNRCGQPNVSVLPAGVFNNPFGNHHGQLSRGNITGSHLTKEGKRLWFINDAFLNTPSGELMIRNAIVVEEHGLYKSILGGDAAHPTALIESEKGKWISINNGALIQDAIEIVATVFEKNGEGAFDFEVAKTLLVKLDASAFNIKSMEERNASEILWGSALYYEDEFVYIFGTRTKDYSKEVFLTRSPGGSIWDQWMYYDGHAWSQSLQDARPISDVLSSASDYFHVWNTNGRYFLVVQNGLFGEEVNLFSSDNLARNWRFDQILYCRSAYDDKISFNTIVHHVNETQLECSYGLIDKRLSDFSTLSNEFITIKNWKPF